MGNKLTQPEQERETVPVLKKESVTLPHIKQREKRREKKDNKSAQSKLSQLESIEKLYRAL